MTRYLDSIDLLTYVFNGLCRNCETGEWQNIDVACPGLAEPYRSRVKRLQQREEAQKKTRAALLYGADGKMLVKR